MDVLATALAALAFAAPAQAEAVEPPPLYWQTRHCAHGHRSKRSYKVIHRHVFSHRPQLNWRRIRHWSRCVATRKKSRAVWRMVRRGMEWRRSYAHHWPIVFNRFPAWARAWAWSTGACESGNNPSTATGNGFYGAFQFLLSTWWAAGGQGNPAQHSWHYQAVIAIRWLYRAGDEQWPVCGD